MTVQIRFAAVLALVSLAAACSTDGVDGTSCTVTENADGTATIACEDGTNARVRSGANGADGADGTDGVMGPAGTDASCSVTDNADGTKTIRCDDGTMVTVTDGADGARGSSALVFGAGIQLAIQSATIGPGLVPSVTLRMTDADGRPLDREGALTEGAVDMGFTIAALSEDAAGNAGQYRPYNTEMITSMVTGEAAEQPVVDQDGTWTEVGDGDGVYTYTFENAVPADYDPTTTHTMGMWATRIVQGVRYVANATTHFRPDGAEVTATREIVNTSTCNRCHDVLAMHGPPPGPRRAIGVCITCHVQGMADPDTGNTLDFRVMVHRIHSGAVLPSVVAGTPYQFIGFRGSVADFSSVRFPQSTANCDTCHTGASGDAWKASTITVCGSCHDDISYVDPAPAGTTLHSGGPCGSETGECPTTEGIRSCAECHADGTDFPVLDAHYSTFRNPDSPVIEATILEVTDTAPAQTPRVRFRITVDGMGRDVMAMPLDGLQFTFAGPTTDYVGLRVYAPSRGQGTLAPVDAPNGEFTFTFPETVSAAATTIGTPAEGSFAVAIEALIQPSGRSGPTFTALSPVAYVAVTGSAPVARRRIVDPDRCNRCHDDVRAHGDRRRGVEYCVMCHNANADDLQYRPRPAAGSTTMAENIRFGRHIHRIHRGADGDSPYVIYGRPPSGMPPGTANDFSEAGYPGDGRNCEACHDGATYTLPLAPGVLPSRFRILDSTGTAVDAVYQGAAAALCSGCHDSEASVRHGEVMTTALGEETCSVCHGPGRGFDVATVHARPELQVAGSP